MKNFIISLFFNFTKFYKRDSLNKKNMRKSVHFRRDLDSLGEYLEI